MAERRTEVQRWDVIRHNLIGEFNASSHVFDQVLEHSEKYMRVHGGNLPPQNGEEYFERLENNLRLKDMLDFLIAVMERLNLHTDMGTVSQGNVLRGYKETLQACQRAEMGDEEEDRNFVGRKKYIDEIVKMFEDDRNEYKGVSICGMGGLGKTTLANKICRELKGVWRIIKVDLREVTTLREMLRDIFVQLTSQTLIREAEEDILEQIMDFLRKDNAIESKTILMLDNIEDVMNGEGTHRFMKVFLDKFITFLRDFGDKCKIRLLLTSRLLLNFPPLLPDAVSRFWRWMKGRDRVYGSIMEKEILPFESSEAVELFMKCMGEKHKDIKQVERIVKLCGYSPLAITTLCSSMRHGLLNPESIIQDLEPNLWHRHISRTSNVTQCLEKSFESLDARAKKQLIRLSVFHSATFDIDAAAAVLWTTSGNKYTEINKRDVTKQKLLHLRLSNFVEISEHEHMVRYSLHPLVFHLLKTKAQSKHFHKELQIAKENFVEHFRKFISDVAKKIDKDCREGHRMLGYDKKHVKNFYELMATDDLQKLVINKTSDTLITIVESRRIYEIADVLLYDDTKWSLIQNFITKTKASEENQLHCSFWRVCEIALLLDLDRNQEAKRNIDCLDVLFNTMSGQGDVLTMAAVSGSFFFQKGRYFRKEYHCQEAIHYLKLAAHEIKKVTTGHRILLSKIYNVMGGSVYRQKKPDYQLAKSYHEQALRIIMKYTNKSCINIETPEYLQNIGTCLFKQGEAFHKEGKETEAKVKYQEAIRRYDVAVQLGILMKLDEMECHAQILQNRGEAHGAMECWAKAEDDLKASIVLRQKILSPPNRQITIGLFKTAQVLYKKGVFLYHQTDKDHAKESMLWSKTLCEKIADLIINGGLPVTDVYYPEVKELTFKLLDTLQDIKTCKLIRNKYRKFEKGTFDKRIDNLRSIGKSHFTQNQKYGTAWREPAGQADCDLGITDSQNRSDSSSDDNDDDADSKQKTRNMNTDEDVPYTMTEWEAAVDLTGITYVGSARYLGVDLHHPFQASLKTCTEKEDINIADCLSSLIDNIGNLDIDEDGGRGSGDTSMQRRTVCLRSSMDVEDSVPLETTSPNSDAIISGGVVEPPSLEYNIEHGYAVATTEELDRVSKSKADLILVKHNVDLILEEEDTNLEEVDHKLIKQPTRKRTLNQTGDKSPLLPDEEGEEMVMWGKRRHQQDGNETC